MRGQEIVGNAAVRLLDRLENLTEHEGKQLQVREVLIVALCTSGLDDAGDVIDPDDPGISDVFLGCSTPIPTHQRGLVERARDIIASGGEAF